MQLFYFENSCFYFCYGEDLSITILYLGVYKNLTNYMHLIAMKHQYVVIAADYLKEQIGTFFALIYQYVWAHEPIFGSSGD